MFYKNLCRIKSSGNMDKDPFSWKNGSLSLIRIVENFPGFIEVFQPYVLCMLKKGKKFREM